MKKFTSCICSKANGLALRARMALSNQRGDFYISDAVKIIIAVVLGALLLAALTLIFNDTVIPRITQEIEGLFGAANYGLVHLNAVIGDQLVDIHSWSPFFYFSKCRITEVQTLKHPANFIPFCGPSVGTGAMPSLSAVAAMPVCMAGKSPVPDSC